MLNYPQFDILDEVLHTSQKNSSSALTNTVSQLLRDEADLGSSGASRCCLQIMTKCVKSYFIPLRVAASISLLKHTNRLSSVHLVDLDYLRGLHETFECTNGDFRWQTEEAFVDEECDLLGWVFDELLNERTQLFVAAGRTLVEEVLTQLCTGLLLLQMQNKNMNDEWIQVGAWENWRLVVLVRRCWWQRRSWRRRSRLRRCRRPSPRPLRPTEALANNNNKTTISSRIQTRPTILTFTTLPM